MMCSNVDLPQPQADQGDEFALSNRKADVPKRRAAVRRESLFEAIDQKGISHRRSSSLRFWWEKQSLQVYSIPMPLGMWNVLAQSRSSHDRHGTAGHIPT